MIIALFPNTLKSQAKASAIDISHFLKSRGVTVVAEDLKPRLCKPQNYPKSIQTASTS